MEHAGYVFVASIHPSRSWMSGSFKSVLCNARARRQDLGLYSHSKEFWGKGVRTHVHSKGKIPSTGGSEEDRTRNAASLKTGQRAQHTMDWTIPAPPPLSPPPPPPSLHHSNSIAALQGGTSCPHVGTSGSQATTEWWTITWWELQRRRVKKVSRTLTLHWRPSESAVIFLVA